MRTRLSQPAEAKRCTEGALGVPGAGTTREPGMTAGAQETALQPMACPLKMSAPHWPSSGEEGQGVQRWIVEGQTNL